MATAKRATLRNSQRRRQTLPDPLTASGPASADCGAADVLVLIKGHDFSHLDTVNVTYRSHFANPSLSCWCGAPERAIETFRADHVSPFNGSSLVALTFLSDDPCWFELSSDLDDCPGTSEPFALSPNQRIPSDEPRDDAPVPAELRRQIEPFSTTSPLAARTATAVDSQESAAKGDSFSTGAKAALGVGIALICIAVGAMAAFMYFRRRRRGGDAESSGGICGRDRRGGRKAPEKKRVGGSSDASGHSDEPLCPVQPVFDGFPGSTGYEDVRSLHSAAHSHSTHSYSPTAAQSPTHSHTGGFWTQERSIEREELTAARLKSQMQPSAPIVVSYGPNPVTPTLPRVTPRSQVNSLATPITPISIEQTPGHVPMMPLSADFTDYTRYSIPPPAPMPDAKPSPPRPAAAPIVVSYGPNRVTPTPLVVSPTVPPDESIVRRLQESNNPNNPNNTSSSAVSRERQFSFEADSPLLGPSHMGPLPPYATTEDFEAMEKGAVRKLAEPQAQAELPPTKDGFYHYTSDVVEYELPGAAPQHEPQLPFRPYQPRAHALVGGGGRGREVDEQKFLLDDEEVVKMRAEKRRIRAEMAAAEAAASAGNGGVADASRVSRIGEVEEYDLAEGMGAMRR